MPLLLASRSPQRSAILFQLGVDFEVFVADVDELTEGEPGAVVVENALRKARDVAERAFEEEMTVLGADTEVAIGGRILGKPRDEQQAREYLALLSGRSHQVWGGLAVIDGAGPERSAAVVTTVVFRELTSGEISDYIQTGEWRGRAGGYAIQGRGALLVKRIEGDYLNVVGLAVAQLQEIAPDVLVRAITLDGAE